MGGVLVRVWGVSYVAPSGGVWRGAKSGVVGGVVCCVWVLCVDVGGVWIGVVGLFVGTKSWVLAPVGVSVATDFDGAGVRIGARMVFQSNVGGRSSMSRKQSRG